jgi:curved DNA-binding protein CbpA
MRQVPKQQNKNQTNISMTKCHKGGVKIKETNNGYKSDPFENVNPFNIVPEEKRENVKYEKTSYDKLDLNIDNYSRPELYKLFGLNTSMILTEDLMKECKKLVLKTHPDKCQLENKYFIFFSTAYKKLLGIYEFQNKVNSKKTTDKNEYYDSNNGEVLDKMFIMNKDLKDPKNFNNWFNEQFDKHRIEDPVSTGYGNWLKSDEDIIFSPTNITKDKMASEIEKRKKEVKTIVTYSGVGDTFSSTFGGSSLMAYDNNFTSGTLFSSDGMGYTDLRQAYVESVIPVTEDDYNKMQKFNSIDEYKRHRDNTNATPLSKEEAMRQLYNQNKQKDEESAALAFYYAQQSEKVKKNENDFWSGLKQVTNW